MNKKVASILLSIAFCFFLAVFFLLSLVLCFIDARVLFAGEFILMENPPLYFIATLMRALFFASAAFACGFFFLPLLWRKEHRAISTMVIFIYCVLTGLTFFFYEWYICLALLLSLAFIAASAIALYFYCYRGTDKGPKEETLNKAKK